MRVLVIDCILIREWIKINKMRSSVFLLGLHTELQVTQVTVQRHDRWNLRFI